MYLIREIMYCKPGKVRPMVEKFIAMSKLSEKLGLGSFKVMTDFCAERYWTVVSEMEVPNLAEFMTNQEKTMQKPEFQEAMKGYHDLVEYGRREIYTLEK
jgi:cobyrinic acid a,c-diamide synthase